MCVNVSAEMSQCREKNYSTFIHLVTGEDKGKADPLQA
jgi:hypothetical protein